MDLVNNVCPWHASQFQNLRFRGVWVLNSCTQVPEQLQRLGNCPTQHKDSKKTRFVQKTGLPSPQHAGSPARDPAAGRLPERLKA